MLALGTDNSTFPPPSQSDGSARGKAATLNSRLGKRQLGFELMKNHLELGSEHLTCLRFLSKGFVGVVKGEVKGAADVVGGDRKDKEATHSYKRANRCSFS